MLKDFIILIKGLEGLRLILFSLLLACPLLGCAENLANTSLSASDAELVAELAQIPQDPLYFALAQGPELAKAPLLSQKRHEEASGRAVEHFFSPWGLKKAAYEAQEALWAYFSLKPERGYMENLRPYSQERWRALVENSDVPNYPSLALKAITVDAADLRLMPTASPYFFDPTRPGQGYPFDYYQNSSLPLGTPVLISHISKDSAWALVESPSAGGWVHMDKLALVDEEFIIAWKSRPLGTILYENTALRPLSKATGAARAALPPTPRFASIGTILPLEEFPRGFGPLTPKKSALYYPVKDENGYARLQRAVLNKDEIAPWPLMPSRLAMASLMAQMIGQPYGWGGYGGNRDCSSTLRDLFLAFGVWLPRNSKEQAGLGRSILLEPLSAAEKEQSILREGVPFLSLVGQPGHIMLYIGEYDGRAMVFHNMWGLRTVQKGSKVPGRLILGKAVITSLRPGSERGDIAWPDSLLDSVNRLSFPLMEKQEN